MSERLNDMLDRYGEVCPQRKAAQILSVTPRTIARMMDACAAWECTWTSVLSATTSKIPNRWISLRACA